MSLIANLFINIIKENQKPNGPGAMCIFYLHKKHITCSQVIHNQNL